MTILEQFKAADKKVNDIENNDGLILSGYGGTSTTTEYDKAIEEAQKLYQQCIDQGVNPFE